MITNENKTVTQSSHVNLPKTGWVLFAICILGIMIQIDFTAVNVALVAIAHSIHSDLTTVQWVLSSYVLAWGSLVLAAGRLADIFGKRRTFLIGTLLFIIGSGLAGAAHHAWFLILSRVIQGIGGALFCPGLYTLIFTAFPEHKRGAALGYLTSAIAIGLAIGPTFGGIVLHLLNWRWIFFLNLPLGFPVIAIILWAVDREPWRVLDEAMDYSGAILVGVILFILMYALNRVDVWGISSITFLISILIVFILTALLIIYERKRQYPLINMDIFTNKIFVGCSLSYIFMGFNFSSILILGSLYLQNALDYSPLNTGFIFLIMTVMFGTLSVYGGKLVDRMDPRIPIIVGGLGTLASLLVFACCTQHSGLWLPMLALALSGIGSGLAFPALNATMMKSIPAPLLSTASGAFAMFGCVGNTIGLIYSSVMIVALGASKLTSLGENLAINPDQWKILHGVIGSTHYSASQLTSFTSDMIPKLLDMLRTSFVHAMSITLLIAAVLAIINIVVVTVLIKFTSDRQ